MKRFVLVPHRSGWGHRIRCDRIGRALLSASNRISVSLYLPDEDRLTSHEWTALPVAASRFSRLLKLAFASVVVEDGFFPMESRIRLLKRLGRKVAVIIQPVGFGAELVVRKSLRAADLILVPVPETLFLPEAPLREFTDKVRVIQPILDLEGIERNPRADRILLYCQISRPDSAVVDSLKKAEAQITAQVGKPVIIYGGLGQYIPVDDHRRLLGSAHVIITQGITAAFEARAIGVPLLLLPSRQVPEQLRTAEVLSARGEAIAILPDKVSLESIVQAVVTLCTRQVPSSRPEGEGSGIQQAVGSLAELAGLRPASTTLEGPQVSVLSTNYTCAHALQQHLESVVEVLHGMNFEYILVDNLSRDRSPDILRSWASGHPEFRWFQQRCTMGRGRELAYRESRGKFLLVVDTDTVYSALLRTFVDRTLREYPGYAIQAIYAGLFPRYLWRIVGGRANLNTGEDFEMWMRLAAIGRMRWYPVRMGDNRKESWARDSMDYLSQRYSRSERFVRILRREFDLLQLAKYERLDLIRLWRENAVDFGLRPLESTWFGERRSGGLVDRTRSLLRAALRALCS